MSFAILLLVSGCYICQYFLPCRLAVEEVDLEVALTIIVAGERTGVALEKGLEVAPEDSLGCRLLQKKRIGASSELPS